MSRDPTPFRPELDRLQRWMQEVVVHPGTVDEALASSAAEREIPAEKLREVVRPSEKLTASERVGVYHGMYLMRMEEALETDFPLIRNHLGADGFADFASQYVLENPSTSYSLNRLGDRVPQFFANRPDWPQAGFLHDLARLELAMTEVFDEEESPVLDAGELEKIDPDLWENTCLRPIAALRLMAFRHAVIPHLIAYHDDRPSPSPRRRASWVVLYRRDYSVLRLELDRNENNLLQALVAGEPLGEALASAAGRELSLRKQTQIFNWFRTWISEGLFSRIEAPSCSDHENFSQN